MFDFLSEKTRVPFIHVAVITAALVGVLYVFWNVFLATPILFGVTTYAFPWFVFACTLGLFSFVSPAVFPYVLTFLPLARERDRFSPMRASLFSLVTFLCTIALGYFAAYSGGVLISYISKHSSVSFFLLAVEACIVVAYGVGLYWHGVLIPKVSLESTFSLRIFRRTKSILGDIVYSGFAYIVDILSFLWIPIVIVALHGNPVYGVYIFFGYAFGRVLPVVITALYGAFHVDISHWLYEGRAFFKNTLGWLHILVAVIFLAIVIPLHINSSTFLVEYKNETLFSLDVLLPLLLTLPLWLMFFRDVKKIYGPPHNELHAIKRRIRILQHIYETYSDFITSRKYQTSKHVLRMENSLSRLEYESRMLAAAVRHRIYVPLRSPISQEREEARLWRKLISVSLLSFCIISLYYIML